MAVPLGYIIPSNISFIRALFPLVYIKNYLPRCHLVQGAILVALRHLASVIESQI